MKPIPAKEARGPVRTCLGCRAAGERDRLVRLAAGPDRRVVADLRHRLGGRGTYVHPRLECLRRALRPNLLKAALRTDGLVVPEPEALAAEIDGLVKRRLAGLLASALTTGHLEVGSDAGKAAVDRGVARLLVAAEDADPSAKPLKAADRSGVPVVRVGTRSWLGSVLGRGDVGSAAVTDKGLARALEEAASLLPREAIAPRTGRPPVPRRNTKPC